MNIMERLMNRMMNHMSAEQKNKMMRNVIFFVVGILLFLHTISKTKSKP